MKTVERCSDLGISRRAFMAVAAGTITAVGCANAQANGLISGQKKDATAQLIEVPVLPFTQDALEPVISARTLSFHHGKHHLGYVKKLNSLLPDSPFQGKTLEEIVRASAGHSQHEAIFNNAAQVWNHTFYWHSLAPSNRTGTPSDAFVAAMQKAFGSIDAFRAALLDVSLKQFGSGWSWLVAEKGTLKVVKTANAETPLTEAGVTPLLTVDVWEHAYYLDWQNRRGDYVKALLEKVVNWQVVSERFASANT